MAPDKLCAASDFCPTRENDASNARQNSLATAFESPTVTNPVPVVVIGHCDGGALEERSVYRSGINAEYRSRSNEKLGRPAFCHALAAPTFAARHEMNSAFGAGSGLFVAVRSVSAHSPP